MPLRPAVTLEILSHRGDGRLPGLMGFRVTAIEDGMLAAELDIRPELLAPNGYLHAATIIALADTACGYGCLAHLPAGAENFTTVELKSNFFSTAREGTIATVARPCTWAIRRKCGMRSSAARRTASKSRCFAVRSSFSGRASNGERRIPQGPRSDRDRQFLQYPGRPQERHSHQRRSRRRSTPPRRGSWRSGPRKRRRRDRRRHRNVVRHRRGGAVDERSRRGRMHDDLARQRSEGVHDRLRHALPDGARSRQLPAVRRRPRLRSFSVGCRRWTTAMCKAPPRSRCLASLPAWVSRTSASAAWRGESWSNLRPRSPTKACSSIGIPVC